ncbi:MAG: helix-turn-helix domain-containing protein [candidate division WOR-3 bacterium]|nr:helix-turn-helix domain-containing protein [candidate division WOR-3 bacterium]
MPKDRFYRLVVTETGSLLAKIRKSCHLTQTDIAKGLGFSEKSGKVFISRLENGKLSNPSLSLVLNYLNVCKVPWDKFFDKLERLINKYREDEIISKISAETHHRKIARDVSKYLHSIETKFSQKKQIKPLSPEQIEKMAINFGRHRVIMEKIEAEVHKRLCARGDVPFILFPFYKDFCRECYSVITKAQKKENTEKFSVTSVVEDKLSQKIERWKKKGLNQEILEDIKAIICQNFNLIIER